MSSPDNNTKHDGFTESLTQKIEKNLFKIEQRTDLSDDEKASRIIHIFSATCAAAATQPLPFADIFVLTTIQAYMAERLSAVRGVPLTKTEAITVVTDLAKVIGLGMVAQQVALGLYKVGLPFLAGFTTIPLVYGLTYGIGKTLDAMFIKRYQGETLSHDEIKQKWGKYRSEGIKEYQKTKGKDLQPISNDSRITYLRKNISEKFILAFFIKISFEENFAISEKEELILSALRRSSEEFSTSNLKQISQKLREYDHQQITGLVSNVKGIAHEMQFINIENTDGDSTYAVMYPNTNHPGYDIELIDQYDQSRTPIQLKATDHESSVESWIENHPNGIIYVTDELAQDMDISSSGISNEQITIDVKEFVDKLILDDNSEGLSALMPLSLVIAIPLIIFELYTRYAKKELSFSQFKELVLKATGQKVAKLGVLITLLSIPGVNYVTGTFLVARFIHQGRTLAIKSSS